VALNETEGFAGVTTMEESTPELTVRFVEPLTEPKAAAIAAVPVFEPVARPVFEIVATAVFDEVQVTKELRFEVLLFV